jgi:hypothetical protein
MVTQHSAYDFSAILDGLLARRKIQGPHAAMIIATTRERCADLLSQPDIRYMPAFKILDLLGAMIEIAAAITQATQLRPNEVHALLRESFCDDTALMRQFMLEAALERARYEPIMLEPHAQNPEHTRSALLARRWLAMRTAHQEKFALPDAWLKAVDAAAYQAITAADFADYRLGPLLQMLAEMLAQSRKTYEQDGTITSLMEALSPRGAIWRRYALKAKRYGQAAPQTPDITQHTSILHTIH